MHLVHRILRGLRFPFHWAVTVVRRLWIACRGSQKDRELQDRKRMAEELTQRYEQDAQLLDMLPLDDEQKEAARTLLKQQLSKDVHSLFTHEHADRRCDTLRQEHGRGEEADKARPAA